MKIINVLKWLLVVAYVNADDCRWKQVGSNVHEDDVYAFNDDWGMAVTLNEYGTVMAIGDMFDDSNGANTGHVRVFTLQNGDWIQRGSDINGEAAGDLFGRSVSLSSNGKILAVGAIRNDPNGVNAAGRTRVFEWKNSQWVRRGSDIDGTESEEYLGCSVSLSSDGLTLAIGSRFYDGADGARFGSGKVQLYKFSGSGWAETYSIDGRGPNDGFGRSVSLSNDGNTLSVGAWEKNEDGKGYTEVYEQIGNNWNKIGSALSGESDGDRFGQSVSVSSDGKAVAIGAGHFGQNSGQLKVFYRSGNNWVQKGQSLYGENDGDFYGTSVSLSSNGDIVAVGGLGNDYKGVNAGQTQVFRYVGGSWVQMGDDIFGISAYDRSGFGVSLSGSGYRVAITGWNQDDGSRHGLTQVFDYEECNPPPPPQDCSWMQVGSNIHEDDAYDFDTNWGMAVTLNEYGTVMAIGDMFDDSNGANTGLVRVFTLQNGDWKQRGYDIIGEAAGDQFGRSVSLSADGAILAIGAIRNDPNGVNAAGHTRVFEWKDFQWVQRGSDIDGTESEEYLGVSTALSSDGLTLAIGSRFFDGANGENSGKVQIYKFSGGRWIETYSIDGRGPHDGFGRTVSLSNDGYTLSVGAWEKDDETGSGYTQVFAQSGNSWNKIGSDLNGDNTGDRFGQSVSVNSYGNTVAIGGGNANENAGQMKVFYKSGNNWLQKGQNVYGEKPGDFFGQSVSLSSDGNIVAVGSNGNDNNGVDAGHTRVFRYVGGSWAQMGNSIDGKSAYDKSGYGVSLSGSGKRVAITGWNQDDGSRHGLTQVFDYHECPTDAPTKSPTKPPTLPPPTNPPTRPPTDPPINVPSKPPTETPTKAPTMPPTSRPTRSPEEEKPQHMCMGTDIPPALGLGGYNVLVSDYGFLHARGHRERNQTRDESSHETGIAYVDDLWRKDLLPGSSLYTTSTIKPARNFNPDNLGTLEGDDFFYFSRYKESEDVFIFRGVGVGNPEEEDTTYQLSHDDGLLVTFGGVAVNEAYIGIRSLYIDEDPTLPDVTEKGLVTLYRNGVKLEDMPSQEFKGSKVMTTTFDGQEFYRIKSDTEFDAMSFVTYSHSMFGGTDEVGEHDFYVEYIDLCWPPYTPAPTPAPISIPEVSGDPHFKTWSGTLYDFHGVCDLVLLSNPGFRSGIGMDIHIRTKQMKQFSYVSTAVLRIGEDTLEVMGDNHENLYWINKEASGDLGKGIKGYPIKSEGTHSHQRTFTVDLGDGVLIVMRTYKRFVHVDIENANEETFGRSRGLWGTFPLGEMMTRRKHRVLEDTNAFGQEWQVRPMDGMLFHNVEGPQAPEKCEIPQASNLRRRLAESDISEEQAKIACASVSPTDFDMCVFDVMATGDKNIVGAY